jgi:hypothetical protein
MNRGYSKFPSLHGSFFERELILEQVEALQKNESVASQNLNDESTVSHDQENESMLSRFDQSASNEEHGDV